MHAYIHVTYNKVLSAGSHDHSPADSINNSPDNYDQSQPVERSAQPLVLWVVSDLTLAAAVDHSQAATTLLKLHLTGRLVQPVELTGGVGASDELP